MKKREYQNYVRNTWPMPFVEPWIFAPTELEDITYCLEFILVTHCGDKGGWHYYEDTVRKVGDRIVKHLLNRENLEEYHSRTEEGKKECLSLVEQYESENFDSYNSKDLQSVLSDWYRTFSNFSSIACSLDAIDEVLEEKILFSLKKEKHLNNAHVLHTLLIPDTLTYVQNEEQDFSILLKEKEEEKRKELIQKHVDQWWWATMGWGQHSPMSVEYIEKRLEDTDEVNFRSRLEEDYVKHQDILSEKEVLKNKLNSDTLNLLSIYEIAAPLHDERKEVQVKMMRLGIRLTEIILSLSNLDKKYRDFIRIPEYQLLLEGEAVPKDELDRRKEAYWLSNDSVKGCQFFSGEAAKKRIQENGVLNQNFLPSSTVTKFEGQSAYKGKVTGKVRIGLEPNELATVFNEGDILVTGMTTPDFVALMKKASAIITDEGGITCHAAIIARELKKPCIIGTKIATQVLKDGDMVEVDADKGVVRILEN